MIRTSSIWLMKLILLAGALCMPVTTFAQNTQGSAPSTTGRPIFAVGYRVGSGSTMIDLKSTGLVAAAHGEARIEARSGVTTVEVRLEHLRPATSLATEFITYVLWAVSPEGRAINLGEVLLDDGGKAKLKTTTQLQSFSLFVTAEPYSAVRQPSEVIVLENALRENTRGMIFPVKNYQLMKRSQYEKLGNPLALSLDLKNVPIEMYEARNAIEIARSRGAGKYAPGIFSRAEAGLRMAERALAQKASKKEVISLARQTAQSAEDARALTAERQEAERIATERDAAAAAARARAEEKATAEAAEARQRVREEARRQAELASAREAQLRAEAETAKIKADAERQALKAKEEAARAEAEAARLAAAQLRAQLFDQFNRILETRDTPRGLVITMADVLFDTGKYDLRSATREQLAKISGILLAHPGLFLEVEGYTDATGGDDFNQRLSERRASTVRDYLVAQGLAADAVTSKGLGKALPVATNDTPLGRQKNRRVELIVSGEVIGVRIGAPHAGP